MEYIVSHIDNTVTIDSTSSYCKKPFTMSEVQFVTSLTYLMMYQGGKLTTEQFLSNQSMLIGIDILLSGLRGKKAELNTLEEFAAYCKDQRKRIDMRGVDFNQQAASYFVLPEIGNDVFYSFCSKISSTVLRAKIAYHADVNTQIKKIKEMAVRYGVADTESDLSIDLDEHVVYFKTFKKVAVYKNDGTYEILADSNKGVDLRGKGYNNAEMQAAGSLVGAKASTQMTTVTFKKLGDKTYTVAQLFAELYCMDKRFQADRIRYLGFTPSNYMFKVLVDGTMWSVTFGSLQDVYEQRAKNISVRNSNIDSYWAACIADASEKKLHPIYVIKCSEKSGSAYTCKSNLHAKYPTMRDLYVDPSFNY